jgi:hypothetical protein
MYDIVEGIHKALKIESTWAFVLVVALGSAMVGGFFAWIIDAGYKNSAEYKAEHPPKQQAVTVTTSSPVPQTVTVPNTSIQRVQKKISKPTARTANPIVSGKQDQPPSLSDSVGTPVNLGELPRQCLHPVPFSFRETTVPGRVDAHYAIVITIPNDAGFEDRAQFQLFFGGNNRVGIDKMADGDGNDLLGQIGSQGGIATIRLGHAVPKGVSVLVTAFSGLFPIKDVLCIDQLATPVPPQPPVEQHGTGNGAVGGSITQGPCSNLQVGGVGNQQTTNCTIDTPPRTISLKVLSNSPASSISFKIWVDRDFPNAKFVVICDRPCKAIDGNIDWEGRPPNGAMLPQVQIGTVPGIPETGKVAAFVVDHPEVMGSDVSLMGVVKSSDGEPIRIVGVKPLTITPPR